MKDKIILKDGTVIELEAAASLTGLTTVFADWAEAAQTMIKLTEENLASVQVQTGEGLTVGNYADLVLQPGAWVFKDGRLNIVISLREKTEVEKRLDSVEEGQQTQDGAISDLGEAVGKLAEGGVQ